MERCPTCRSRDTIYDAERGETCCRVCGTVLDDRAGVGENSDMSTPVMPGARPTVIGPLPKDNRIDNAKLAKNDGWVGSDSVPSAMRSGAMSRLHAVCEKIGLPDAVHTRAIEVYTMAATAGLTGGRTIKSVMGASAYVACREAGVPRTMLEVAEACDLRKRMMSKDVMRIMRYCGINPAQYDMPLLISRLANMVGAGTAAVRAAVDVAERMDRTYSGGKNPTILAAALLYTGMHIVGDDTSACELARTAGVSDLSVRNRYHEMVEMGIAPRGA